MIPNVEKKFVKIRATKNVRVSHKWNVCVCHFSDSETEQILLFFSTQH